MGSLDKGSLAVHASGPAAWAAHTVVHLLEANLDAAFPGLLPLCRGDPTDPLVACEGGEAEPELLRCGVGLDGLPEICGQPMYCAVRESARSHVLIRFFCSARSQQELSIYHIHWARMANRPMVKTYNLMPDEHLQRISCCGTNSCSTGKLSLNQTVGRKTRMIWSKPKTISFDDAQRVLVTVLKDVRCTDWAGRVAGVSASSFRSLLGGMGSFSDLVICRENHHEISSEREPLANELVSCLSSVCYTSSREGALTADTAVASCGTLSLVLSGWRCLACGHAQTTSTGVRSLIAGIGVRCSIRDGIAQRSPSDTLIALWRAPEDFDNVRSLVERARTSDIGYSESDSWMRPCPVCGSDDTRVYRWREDGDRFVPTDDNLPLRNG